MGFRAWVVCWHGPSLNPLPLTLHKHDMVLHSSSVQSDDGVALRPEVKTSFKVDTQRAQYRLGCRMFSFVVFIWGFGLRICGSLKSVVGWLVTVA